MTATVQSAADKSRDVESPCTGVCKLDDGGNFCTGCLRTRFEIGVWSRATDTEKSAILDRIAQL